MRAASYAIGVMKALSEFEQLDSLDMISGVSGGTYAMMWYYTGLYSGDRQSESNTSVSSSPLFTDLNLDNFVREHTRSHYAKHDALNTASTTVAGTVLNAWDSYHFLPDTYLRSRLDDPLLFEREGILGSIYRERLKEFYVNYGDITHEIPSLSELNTFVKKHHLPWPVFNTTAYDDQNATKFERKRIFEVTPFMLGSDSVGYAAVTDKFGTLGDRALDKSLIDYVTASGAALDVPLSKPSHFVRASTGLGLGMKIYAPNNSHGESNKSLYLADGGFSENLGAYALSRRKCEVNIIVDAEYDPWFHFEGYYALKKHVSDGLGMHLAVPDIDDHLKEVVKNPIVCLDGSAECNPAKSTWDLPLMEGTIAVSPKIANRSGKDDQNLEVRYLKLSVNRDKGEVDTLPMRAKQCAVGGPLEVPESYFSKSLIRQIGKASGKDRDSQFPQIDTLNQWLLEDRVKALVDLGYAHMKAMICRKQIVEKN